MNTTPESLLSPELMAEFKAAVEYAKSGKRDPEVMKKAFDEMDRIREQIFKREGILDIAVPIIRELRDS